MKILFASDSFKGSLSSEDTIELLTKAAHEVFGECDTIGVPVADGGEGTVDAIVKAERGEIISCLVHGPRMDLVEAHYGVFGNNNAVIEMSSASGLTLLSPNRRNPLYTSTYGTGELIKDALMRGYRKISVAIGGSATNDGGMGCARALGVRFLDNHAQELEGYGRDLINVETIDISQMDERLAECEITVMCDVTNPLCGENGATMTFGAQKGANEETLRELEAGMCHYRDIIKNQFGVDCDTLKGAGAAGGLGAALSVFFNGNMKSGIDTVLELIQFDERLDGVDMVVTGEGQTDWQSCYGKVMQGIAVRASKRNIPVLGLSGALGKDALDICKYGVSSLMTTVNAPMSLEEAISNAEHLYYEGAVRMFRFVKAGMNIVS